MAEASHQLRPVIYARVSTEEQREGQTIDSQIAQLERFAADHSWPIIQVYKDEGWSGGVLARPALDQLRDHARTGRFNAVLVNDVDRLARDVTHLGVVKRDLERSGIQVMFRKLPNENSPTHNLMVNILGSFAEFEREMIADRTRRGRLHKIEARQEYLGGNTAYGYRYIPADKAAGRSGLLQIVPEEAAIVRRMFAWVDNEGLSARRVLQRLNGRSMRPRSGKQRWGKSSVLRILHNEMYAGTWYYNKYQAYDPGDADRSGPYRKHVKYKLKRRSRSEWVALHLPKSLRIITDAQYRRVQQQLAHNLAFSPRNEKHAYLLKGLIRCAGCGARYVGDPNHGKFGYRCIARCKRCPMVKEDALNAAVWQAVEQALLNPELILEQVSRVAKNSASQHAEQQADRERLEAALKQIAVEESRLLEAYRQAVITPSQLGSELEKLYARRTSAQTQQDKVTALDEVDVPETASAVADYCRHIAERLPQLTLAERQQLLRTLIREIIFDGKQAIIYGEIPARGTPTEAGERLNGSLGCIGNHMAGHHARNSRTGALLYSSNKDSGCGQTRLQFKLDRSVESDTTKIQAAARANLAKAQTRLKTLYARGWSPRQPNRAA